LSQDSPNTEEGTNWTVVVFRCPRKNWTETLRSFFSELDKQRLSMNPHYTMRSFEPSTDSLIISFRVLRKQEHEESVKSLIEKLLENYEHETDPKAGTTFSSFHTWIRHGEKDPKWTPERCHTLSKLSRFVLEIINSNTTFEQRREWLHLFANMSVIFQIKEELWTPETCPETRIVTHLT
jgi:hypothetical protein